MCLGERCLWCIESWPGVTALSFSLEPSPAPEMSDFHPSNPQEEKSYIKQSGWWFFAFLIWLEREMQFTWAVVRRVSFWWPHLVLEQAFSADWLYSFSEKCRYLLNYNCSRDFGITKFSTPSALSALDVSHKASGWFQCDPEAGSPPAYLQLLLRALCSGCGPLSPSGSLGKGQRFRGTCLSKGGISAWKGNALTILLRAGIQNKFLLIDPVGWYICIQQSFM